VGILPDNAIDITHPVAPNEVIAEAIYEPHSVKGEDRYAADKCN
jgi:hypothetical protein